MTFLAFNHTVHPLLTEKLLHLKMSTEFEVDAFWQENRTMQKSWKIMYGLFLSGFFIAPSFFPMQLLWKTFVGLKGKLPQKVYSPRVSVKILASANILLTNFNLTRIKLNFLLFEESGEIFCIFSKNLWIALKFFNYNSFSVN